MKLVHWPSIGGLLHLAQRGRYWVRPQPAQAPLLAVPTVTAHPSTASLSITVLLCNGPLLCGFNVPIKLGLIALDVQEIMREQVHWPLTTFHRARMDWSGRIRCSHLLPLGCTKCNNPPSRQTISHCWEWSLISASFKCHLRSGQLRYVSSRHQCAYQSLGDVLELRLTQSSVDFKLNGVCHWTWKHNDGLQVQQPARDCSSDMA